VLFERIIFLREIAQIMYEDSVFGKLQGGALPLQSNAAVRLFAICRNHGYIYKNGDLYTIFPEFERHRHTQMYNDIHSVLSVE